LLAPFLTVTAVWQSQLALAHNENNESLARDLKLFADLAAAALVLVAASPMGTTVGTIFHTVFAGGVVAFGLNYSIRAQTLAQDRGQEALSIMRQITWIVGAVGALVVLFTTYPAVLCTEKLKRHEQALGLSNAPPPTDEEITDAAPTSTTTDILTVNEIRIGRLVEVTLATGQVSQAIMLGIVLISAAAEVGDIHGLEDTSNEALVVGLGSAAGAAAIAIFFAVFNTRFFRFCQESLLLSNETTEVSGS
jgi:hypothetical protein